jgi:hypothetical protein
MRKKKLVIILLALLLMIFLISSPFMPKFFIGIRGDKVDWVCMAWLKADENWNNGKYLNALGDTLQALWMTVDFEVRIQISKPFFERSRILEKQGHLEEAIDLCLTGANLMARYDMEGEYYYYCSELEMQQYNKTLPSGDSAIYPTTP